MHPFVVTVVWPAESWSIPILQMAENSDRARQLVETRLDVLREETSLPFTVTAVNDAKDWLSQL